MTTQIDKRQIGEGMIAAMQGGDLDRLLSYYDASIETFEPRSLPYGGTWVGHEGFATLLQRIMGLADLSLDRWKIHETDDGLIIEFDISFTSRKDGEVLNTSVVEIDRLNDGLVREIDVFYKDVAALNEFFARQSD